MTGTVLVSGFVNARERTDQFIFDLLNHEDSAFDFTKIVAFVDDVKFAKKRLLSRSARYTGLLDKLGFEEASTTGAFPTAQQLGGVTSWIANIDAAEMNSESIMDKVKAAAAIAKTVPSLENLSIMITNASPTTTTDASVVEALKDSGKDYTLLMMGQLEDRDEGKTPYTIRDFAAFENDADMLSSSMFVFSRDEAMRMVTETLQLEAGANKALVFADVRDVVNATEAKLIRGLREAGYGRSQEIDHMLRDGIQKYQKALDEFDEKNPSWRSGVKTTHAWWEEPEFRAEIARREAQHKRYSIEKAKQKSEDLQRQEKILSVKLSSKQQELLDIANDWTKREFYKQSMAGLVAKGTTELDFRKANWDQATGEAIRKYDELRNVESDDFDPELLDFETQQKLKEQAMLKKAKKELQAILDEENLGNLDEIIENNKNDDYDDPIGEYF